jgi:hypothetical protein
MELLNSDVDTSEFEPEPVASGYLAQVLEYLPDERHLGTRKRHQKPITAQFQSIPYGRVELKIARGWPRRAEHEHGPVQGDYSVLVRVGYPPEAAEFGWQRAPDPEEVARRVAEHL